MTPAEYNLIITRLNALGLATIGAVQGGLPSFGLSHATGSEILQLLPVAAS